MVELDHQEEQPYFICVSFGATRAKLFSIHPDHKNLVSTIWNVYTLVLLLGMICFLSLLQD